MKKYIIALFIFLLTYAIYNRNDNFYGTTDSLPINFNTIDIINSGRVDLNNYRKLLDDGGLIGITTENKQNNSIYSKQPFINTLLSVPYFYIYTKIHHISNFNPQHIYEQREVLQIIGKKFASLLTAGSVAIIFLVMANYFHSYTYALIGSFIYAFATFAYGTSSQANGTHANSALLISLTYLILSKLNKSKNQYLTSILGICTALAYTIRPVNIIFLITTIIILIIQKQPKKNILLYFLGIASVLISYNYIILVNHIPFGVGGEITNSLKNINIITAIKVVFTIIFSPNLGLLIYYPILVFSFLGIIRFLVKKKFDTTLIFSFFAILGVFGLNSIWWAWWSGYSWGSRLLTEATIPLVFFLIYFLKNTNQNVKKYLIVGSLFALSTFNNLVGIYCNDFSWHAKYLRPGYTFQASWNLTDPIFPYYINRRYFSTKDMSYVNNKIVITNRAYLFVPRQLAFIKTIEVTNQITK